VVHKACCPACKGHCQPLAGVVNTNPLRQLLIHDTRLLSKARFNHQEVCTVGILSRDVVGQAAILVPLQHHETVMPVGYTCQRTCTAAGIAASCCISGSG
jgi:hypothetical protein